MSFTHLHLHTCYSLLDGAGKINDLVKRAKALGQSSLAITDHGVMYGVVDFFTTCITNGIKPIIGSEIYVVKNSRFNKSNSTEHRYHLILLAENDIGYKNLIKIVSIGFTEGFYYKPRVDYEILSKYHEGLICLTACIAGEVPSALIMGDYSEAKNRAENLINIFGKNNFFIEIQNHNIKEEKIIHPDLVRLSNELDIPLVATNDVHYTLKEDSFAHDCLLCLQTKKTLADEDRMMYEKEKFYLNSEDEMLSLFNFCESAVYNTQIIADRCNVHMEFTKSAYEDILSHIDKNVENGIITSDSSFFKSMIRKVEYHVPKFNVPMGFTNEEYLTKLVYDGIKKKYDDIDSVKKRVDYELNVIIKMGFVDYFLIVWDYIHFAKTNDIPVGPGRGSAVGSIVAYALSITEVDPIKYNLLFERFLNPERVSMPDIDTDFCIVGRENVIDYVKDVYGNSQVSQIVTFNTLAAKLVVKDIGRVQGVKLDKVSALSNLIPNPMSKMLDDSKISLYKIINSDIEEFNVNDRENIEKIRIIYESDEEIKLIINTSIRLEGLPRNASVHASGVLIAPSPITDFVPFARGKEKNKILQGDNDNNSETIVAEYDMITLEKLGLLKMDFLGLRNVTAIKECINIINKNHNINFDINKIPYDDKNVFEMIASGDTLGIFQLESQGMTNFMKKLKPESIEHLIAGISLYRPGPMDFIPKYIDGKLNPKNITYETKELKPILEPTYGCIVYQEQVMQIVQSLAGFSIGKADEVRRAMSKKKPEKLEEKRKNFVYGNEELNIDGCIKRNIDENIANHIFDELIQFGRYAFNKSHAAAYAILAYQTAYLKYYYRPEFYTSICNSVTFKRDKLSFYVHNIKNNKINILPVNINSSYDEFTVDGENIRMGFSSIKRVGANIAIDIIKERETNGLYKTFNEAVERIAKIGGNKNVFEPLILCGAFDDFPGNRNQKMHIYPKIVEINSTKSKRELEGQISIFDVIKEDNENIDIFNDSELLNEFADVKDYSDEEKLFTEKEYTGIYLSGHPTSKYINIIKNEINSNSLNFAKGNTSENNDFDSTDEINESSNTDDDFIASENNIFNVGDDIRIVGNIEKIKTLRTKKTEELMATVTFSDEFGEFNSVIFPKAYKKVADKLYENNIVYIVGKYNVDYRDESGKVYIDDMVNINDFIKSIENLNNQKNPKIKLYFYDANIYTENIENINNIIKNFTGNEYIKVLLVKEKKTKIISDFPIDLSSDVINEINKFLTENNLVDKIKLEVKGKVDYNKNE